jgi:hypothetical protein
MPLQLDLAAAVLLSAVLHALWNSFVKVGNDRLASIAAIVVTGGLLSAPVAAMVPLPATAAVAFIVASVLTHLVYYYCLLNAYRLRRLEPRLSVGARARTADRRRRRGVGGGASG